MWPVVILFTNLLCNAGPLNSLDRSQSKQENMTQKKNSSEFNGGNSITTFTNLFYFLTFSYAAEDDIGYYLCY